MGREGGISGDLRDARLREGGGRLGEREERGMWQNWCCSSNGMSTRGPGAVWLRKFRHSMLWSTAAGTDDYMA